MVPEPDDRLVAAPVLEGEHADAGGPTVEEPPCARRQAEPSGGDHPDDVAAREREHVPVDLPDPIDEAVGPPRDIARRLALRAAVAEQLPAGPLLENIPGQSALEAAV